MLTGYNNQFWNYNSLVSKILEPIRLFLTKKNNKKLRNQEFALYYFSNWNSQAQLLKRSKPRNWYVSHRWNKTDIWLPNSTYVHIILVTSGFFYIFVFWSSSYVCLLFYWVCNCKARWARQKFNKQINKQNTL